MAKSNAMQKITQIAHSKEKDEVRRHLAELGEWNGQVMHSQVLCMTYIQSSVTSGGIHLPDTGLEEDRFQGKIFLVVDLGPGAFKDDPVAKFHGVTLKKNDWVMARPSDGMEFFYNGNTLRLFQDVDIRLKVENPRDFY